MTDQHKSEPSAGEPVAWMYHMPGDLEHGWQRFEFERRIQSYEGMSCNEEDAGMIETPLYTRPSPAPDKTAPVGEVAKWPTTCDGIEQDAFEAWATSERMVMDTHPLHWLFLDAKTNAARKGWKAGLKHAADRCRALTPPAPEAETVASPAGESAHLGDTIGRAEAAKLIHAYYQRQIGRLMQQAQHWHDEGGHPLAVHVRVTMADAYFQVANLFDPAQRALGWDDPFKRMQEELERPMAKEEGKYPPSRELHAYRNPSFTAAKYAALSSPARNMVASEDQAEAVARAIANQLGANWDAKTFLETPGGEEPADMREGFYDLARAAIAALQASPTTPDAVAALREAAQRAHYVMHQCTAVLTANDCAKVAAAMADLRAALSALNAGESDRG